MTRSETAGFGVALLGHGLLLAVLSLGLINSTPREIALGDSMDVQIVDAAAMTSSAPASEAPPQEAEAPEQGPVEEAPPPAAPQSEPLKEKAEPAKPAKPLVPVATKTPATKPAEAGPAASKPTKADPAKARPKATKLGDDFLSGIPVSKTKPGIAAAPAAAEVDAQAMAALVGQIREQVRPCYSIPSGGIDNQSIVTRLRLRMRPDGSIAATPEILQQLGVTPSNQPYARQMGEAAMRAIQRCAPLRLPPELYKGGWDDFVLRFDPRQMH